MSWIIYLYRKCTTCQKALNFLESHHVEFTIKEIKETPPNLKELNKMIGFLGGDVKKLFNTSGILYRELNLSEKLKDMPLDQSLDLLSKNGMLVKRPFLLGSNAGLVGFREAEWLKLFDQN
jgi:arsenate reductase